MFQPLRILFQTIASIFYILYGVENEWMSIPREGYVGNFSLVHDIIPQCKQDIIVGIDLVLGCWLQSKQGITMLGLS